jgi:hypothetical protein
MIYPWDLYQGMTPHPLLGDPILWRVEYMSSNLMSDNVAVYITYGLCHPGLVFSFFENCSFPKKISKFKHPGELFFFGTTLGNETED